MGTRGELTEITSKQIDAMETVQWGGDVYDRETAVLLREVESARPEYISIVKPLSCPPGEMRQPYFGAILTRKGIAALKRWKAMRKNHDPLRRPTTFSPA